MKILIADKLSEVTVTELSALGAEVELRPELTAGDLPGEMAGVNVLVVRSTKVTSATIASASDELPYHENFERHRGRLGEVAQALAPHDIRLGLEFLAPARLRGGYGRLRCR